MSKDSFVVSVVAIFLALVIVFIASLVFAWPVMLLWNWLMPAIFGLMKISFWQAWGLSFLSGLLFRPTSSSSK